MRGGGELKEKRNIWASDAVIVILLITCVALAAVVALVRPWLLVPVGIALLVALVITLTSVGMIRRGVRRVLMGRDNTPLGSGFDTLALPVVVLGGKKLLWYNKAFRMKMTGGQDGALLPMNKLVPGLDVQTALMPGGQDITIKGRRFTAYATPSATDENLTFIVFVDDTALKLEAEEYRATRPVVMYFLIDTYDEVLKEMKESEKSRIITNVDVALEEYIGRTSGFLCRVTSSRYLAVVEERHLIPMLESRFDILDAVRQADEESQLVTLSIGVGQGGNGFKECEEMALQALDMALGRGGDQCAVKTPDSFEFYGGVTRSVEKRNKVKSRIIAFAIRDLMKTFDQVMIMGHRDSDMDSVGAAVGMMRFARICKVPAYIVLDTHKTMAGTLIEALQEGGYRDNLVSPELAFDLVTDRTLLVVVDTHMKGMLESQNVYEACGEVVVIDHHRRMVGYIDDSVIFYHEPYASSASELVTELVQYLSDTKENKLTPLEAEALLAGIMLDTRTFALHVGVRTFEAAAYLRRMGAETASVKQLFSSSMDDYLYRSHLVSEAKIYKGSAFVLSEQVPFESEVVAAQAANDLLTIEGVNASFVGLRQGGRIRFSARSMGEVNVQLVMEKLGGGGHLTMAGAQLENVGCEHAEKQLVEAIDNYLLEHTNTRTDV